MCFGALFRRSKSSSKYEASQGAAPTSMSAYETSRSAATPDYGWSMMGSNQPPYMGHVRGLSSDTHGTIGTHRRGHSMGGSNDSSSIVMNVHHRVQAPNGTWDCPPTPCEYDIFLEAPGHVRSNSNTCRRRPGDSYSGSHNVESIYCDSLDAQWW